MTRGALMRSALLRAGAVLTRHFGKVAYKQKRRADLLTIADLESQRTILDMIVDAFPDDDYKAEEDEVKLSGAEHLWIIDPLDGTTNYAHGYPAACVSIGVMREGKPYLGGVCDPFRREIFLAERSKGAFLNGRRLNVSATPKISASLLSTGFAYDRAERADIYLAPFRAFLTRCHDVRRQGSAALDMAWVAAGRTDGFWEFKLNAWDVAAGRLLVEEAGGIVTDFAGKPWRDWRTMGQETVATNGRIHAETLSILAKTAKRS